MNEIAPLTVHTKAFREIDSALFGFVFGVGLLILAQLVGTVGELALLLVRAKPELEEFLAEL